MALNISRMDTDAAIVFTVDADEASRTIAFPTSLIQAGGPVADGVGSVLAALDMWRSDANDQAKRLLPDALKGHLLATAASVMSKAYAKGQADGIKDAVSIALRAEDRAILRTLDTANLAEAITGADLTRLQAILERPDGIPSQLVDMARDRAMRLSFIQQSGIQADYALSPTAADPLAHGPDRAAAERAADTAMARHALRRDTVDMTRNVLRDAVQFVAVAAGVDQDRAFAALMGQAA
jgi:hypothetical protein